MFYEHVQKLVVNSRRISAENLPFTGNISELKKGFPQDYRGLEVRVGFGQGNWADVTWIGFLDSGQTIQKGIYPVYLYYRDRDILILAYGVSATFKPDVMWPDLGAVSVKDYFAQNNLPPIRKYPFSLVFKAYHLKGAITMTSQYDRDLDILIDYYKDVMNAQKNEQNQAEETKTHNSLDSKCMQSIFYGSPGTGKSWTVQHNVLKDVKEDYIFRTTFHPDTDYSAFVGCYKPIKTNVEKTRRVLSAEDLAAIYVRDVVPTEHLKTGHIEPRIKFGIEYCEYFGGSLGKYDINNVLELAGIELATGCIEDRVGMTYVKYGVSVGLKLNAQKNTGTITYDFVPQVFTEAYIKAWQNPTEQVYLVIEEINRGNCAQIFGDLFQLLDRKKGVSEYPVKAETALAEYLSDVLEGDAAEGIRDGKLRLPANLNIIATMNTSDQSLFPMDSAFKRRWDWKYIPTTPPVDKSRTMELSFKDKTTTKYGTTIDAGDYEYDWTEFLEKINEKIQNATHSDDKQLGFWFVKTEEGAEEITISSFVSKVVFYLWNDVFKDMGAKDSNPFTIKVDGKNVVMPFNSFFEMNSFGQIVENIGVLHTFLRNVGVEPKVKKAIADAQDTAQAKEMTEEA